MKMTQYNNFICHFYCHFSEFSHILLSGRTWRSGRGLTTSSDFFVKMGHSVNVHKTRNYDWLLRVSYTWIGKTLRWEWLLLSSLHQGDDICYSFILSCYCLKNGSSVANSSAFSTTPLVRHKTSPLRKSISVGTDWMRYWLAVTPYLSTSTLMIRMRLPNTFFTCSRMGCIILQGWHHVAKKSTKTSWPPFITSLNVSIIICLFLWNDWKFCRPS